MSAKITDILRDYIISSLLCDPEMVQVWDAEGSINAESLPLSMVDGDSAVISSDFAVTLFIDEMALADADKLKIIVAQFVRFYSHDMEIEWETPRIDKARCQAIFYFEVSEQMRITKTAGKLDIDYCNSAIEGL